MHTFSRFLSLALFAPLALITAVVGPTFSPTAAGAVGNASIYWVYNDGGVGNRIVNAQEAATLTPNAITPATATGYTARTIASDGSYLYFVDNSSGSLVRTGLDGANRTVITNTGGIQQVFVEGGLVYFVAWNDGLYSVPVTGGSPTQIFAPSFITNTCSGASGGWAGVAVTADNLFFSWFNGSPSHTACYGVYQSARSGSTFGTPTKINAPTGGWTTAGWLQLDGNDLYISMSSTTFDKTSDYSTWTRFSVSPASFSLQALYVYGSSVYMTSNAGSVYTMPKTDTTGSSISRLYTNNASSSGYQILAMAPPTYTVTYASGSGTGNDLVQNIAQGSSLTLPSPTACPVSATDPCFTAPSGQRQNGWVDLNGGPAYYSTGQTITPTGNLTLTARWTGGPVQYSTTSFLSGGTAMPSIAFPNTAVGSSNQITVYAYNSGTASIQISNETVGGAGVSRQGGTCNASGGTIAAGAQCTLILQWNPSSAGNLSGGSYQMQVSGSYFDAVTLTGLAATNKTVTFNANTGTGTLANQVAAFTTNLSQNCVSGTCAITRAGYDFDGWNTQALGGGTPYADGASYNFLNNQTMYAQWTAQTFTVTFNTGGGSSVSTGSFTTGGGLTLPAAPTLAGYSFTGWFDAASGGTLIGQPGASFTPGVITNVTLFAQWNAAPDQSGSSNTSALGTTGADVAAPIAAAGLLAALGMAFALMARRRES